MLTLPVSAIVLDQYCKEKIQFLLFPGKENMQIGAHKHRRDPLLMNQQADHDDF